MKILITGGYGNLGSWLTKHFCERGYEVTVLASRQRPILKDLKFNFIACDISNIEECKQKLTSRSFDIVYHTASVNDTFVDNYAHKALTVNTLGTRNLLEALDKTTLKNFIYLSTFHVYGVSAGNITEASPLLARHDYATTHLFGEIYVKQFHLTHKVPYTIIRLTNSYGCPLDMESSKWYLVLNDLARMAFEKHEIVLKSNGQAARDFIWMGDVCEMFEKLAGKDATNDIYNLSGQKTFRMLEIAQAVQKAYQEFSGKLLSVQINEEDKSVHNNELFVSSEKIKKLIPFESKVQFREEAHKIFQMLQSAN